MIYLIAYDIEDDRERMRVSKVLDGFSAGYGKCRLKRERKDPWNSLLDFPTHFSSPASIC